MNETANILSIQGERVAGQVKMRQMLKGRQRANHIVREPRPAVLDLQALQVLAAGDSRHVFGAPGKRFATTLPWPQIDDVQLP
ncbi:hypothetical protein D3C77_516960 [compost metagenome]